MASFYCLSAASLSPLSQAPVTLTLTLTLRAHRRSSLGCNLLVSPLHGGRSKRWRRSGGAACMAPEEEKMTRRSPLDFPIEWERPKPGRRPDIFPQFSPMKTPLPPPLPADPPEEDDEEEEKKEEEEDPEKEESENPDTQSRMQ